MASWILPFIASILCGFFSQWRWESRSSDMNSCDLYLRDIMSCRQAWDTMALEWSNGTINGGTSSYNLLIEHLAGPGNPQDRPSRGPDYVIRYGKPTARLHTAFAAVEPYNYYGLSQMPRLPTHWLPTGGQDSLALSLECHLKHPDLWREDILQIWLPKQLLML